MPDPTQPTPVATPAAPDGKPVEPVTPETPSAAGAKPDEMSSRFAALAKKERISRLAQHNIKQKEAAIAKREQEIAQRQEEIEARFRLWDDEFKKSPLEAIKKRGYSYEDLTKAALNDGKFDPATEVKEVRSELQRLRDEQAEKEKKALEAQQMAAQKAEQEAVDGFKSRIAETIEANKDKYELTSLYEASELVFETVEQHYLATQKEGKPKIMAIDEACELVEKYLESEVERMATTSKKFQSKYGSKPKETEPAKPKSSVTLTNEHTSAAPSMLPSHTENDRIKRALAALG